MTPRSDRAARREGRASIPIVEQISVALDQAEQARLAALAKRLLADDPRLSSLRGFERVSAGLGPGPALMIEDHSAVALFDRDGDIAYAYRALLLAGEGDLVAIGIPRSASFERYCRDLLGLGPVEVVAPSRRDARHSFAMRCAHDPTFVEPIAQRARKAGGLNIVPYMGSGAIWTLAAAIAERAQVDVRVAAPPPRLTGRVNDKLWFA